MTTVIGPAVIAVEQREAESVADQRRRFGGLERLYGVAGAQRIQQSHVVVVGIGGVGSWAAEALARSGVGHIPGTVVSRQGRQSAQNKRPQCRRRPSANFDASPSDCRLTTERALPKCKKTCQGMTDQSSAVTAG